MDEYSVHREGFRDEWWIAPSSPSSDGIRQWRQSEKEAIDDAKEAAIKYNTAYEVYRCIAIIQKD